MKKKILFLLCILSCSITKGQWYNPDKVNAKAAKIYALAYEETQSGKYDVAIQHINEAIKIEPKFVDAYLSRAGVYSTIKNYALSVKDFETGISLDSIYSNSYLLPYSIALAGLGEFDKALQKVNKFLNHLINNIKLLKYRKSTYDFALGYEKKHTKKYNFSPKNLGDSINSDALEYFPSLTIDGSKLIFTRRLNNDEDFYESNLSGTQWGKAEALPGKVNTNLNEGAQTISQDGEWILFTGCNYPEGQGSCDLYISHKTKNGWSEAENMGRVINTESWESSPSLSPDKRDLYFASRQPGGFGGSDIWVSHRTAKGWSYPENLGEAVNTTGDEGCPFMHADNKTLYFNSNGHTGYGATDLFLSQKVNDSSWTVAENLGYPINTIDDEGSLIVAADAKTAFYASDKSDTKGGLDLYTFELREDIRPVRTLWVKGKVYDKNTNAGLPSSVELTDINTHQLISKLQTDEDGNYLTTLPVGANYLFNVNRKGYLFYSDNFSLNNNPSDSVYIKDIALQPIIAGAAIILKNIFFDTKEFILKKESLTELDKIVALMNDNPNVKIQIIGHTDNVGAANDNLLLSNNRAKTVVNYLRSKGVNAGRLSAKGFGAAKPIADNNTENGRAMNRRTEMSVVSN